jgi:hypothetical protein
LKKQHWSRPIYLLHSYFTPFYSRIAGDFTRLDDGICQQDGETAGKSHH